MDRYEATNRLTDVGITFALKDATEELRGMMGPEKLESVLIAMGDELRDICYLSAYEADPPTTGNRAWDGMAYQADVSQMPFGEGELYVLISIMEDRLDDEED